MVKCLWAEKFCDFSYRQTFFVNVQISNAFICYWLFFFFSNNYAIAYNIWWQKTEDDGVSVICFLGKFGKCRYALIFI